MGPNFWATVISAVLTGLFGFFTACLMAKVQQSAANHQNQGSESERAWKKAEKSDDAADAWRKAWAEELGKRTQAEARITVLEARITQLENHP